MFCLTISLLFSFSSSGRQRDTLGEMEEVTGVVESLNALQPWQVGTVICLLPVGQVGVDVVLVGGPAGVLAHRLPCIGQPGVVRCNNRVRIARIPVRRVLGGEQRVAVHEGSCVGGHAVDGTAVCVKLDTALTERGCLAASDCAYQGVDALARQDTGEVV